MELLTSEFPKLRPDHYNNIRPYINTGDILLCSGEGYFGKLIQNATKSIWSHVGLIIRLDAVGRIVVFESVEGIGVRMIPLSKYLYNYNNDNKPYPGKLVIGRHPDFESISKEAFTKMMRFAIDHCSYNYDNDEIARIAGRIVINKLTPMELSFDKIKEDKEFICSEYVARCYKEAGIEINWNGLGYIAPSDFAINNKLEVLSVLKN
jgi:hypothetical protein